MHLEGNESCHLSPSSDLERDAYVNLNILNKGQHLNSLDKSHLCMYLSKCESIFLNVLSF